VLIVQSKLDNGHLLSTPLVVQFTLGH